MRMLMRLTAVLSLVIVASSALAEEVTKAGDLEILQPWARASLVAGRPAALYFGVRNVGNTTDTLLSVQSPVAVSAEIHATTTENGIMTMAPSGPINIDPGGAILLAPGGLHVMMKDLSKPLVRGETVEITLTFATAGEVRLTVPVLAAGAVGPQ